MKHLALSLAAGLLVFSPALAQDHSAHSGAGMAHDKTSKAYMEAMQRMDRDMAASPMTGKPGIDFARMMIPHHQSAIDMARAYLESGESDPRMAEDTRHGPINNPKAGAKAGFRPSPDRWPAICLAA